MGCSCSNVYKQYPELVQWRVQFESLRLSSGEVRKLYHIFKSMDVDGSGTIELIELLAHIDVERTNFTERVFSIFDEDRSGQVDFREFVLSLWNYCTLTKATLDLFAFDLYDQDSSGELGGDEVEQMLKDIYGKESKTNHNAKSVAQEIRKIEKHHNFDIDRFRKFAGTHNAMLFPIFRIQLALQKNILGKRFWERNATRRLKLSDGRYISVAKFMEMHVSYQTRSTVKHEMTRKNPNNQLDSHTAFAIGTTGIRANRKQNADYFNVESHEDFDQIDIHGELKNNALLDQPKAKKRERTINSAPTDQHQENHGHPTPKILLHSIDNINGHRATSPNGRVVSPNGRSVSPNGRASGQNSRVSSPMGRAQSPKPHGGRRGSLDTGLKEVGHDDHHHHKRRHSSHNADASGLDKPLEDEFKKKTRRKSTEKVPKSFHDPNEAVHKKPTGKTGRRRTFGDSHGIAAAASRETDIEKFNPKFDPTARRGSR